MSGNDRAPAPPRLTPRLAIFLAIREHSEVGRAVQNLILTPERARRSVDVDVLQVRRRGPAAVRSRSADALLDALQLPRELGA